ncbi:MULTISPECIES: FHA domain-containing protein [unclassified Nocardioides]|uniref:FHA domain-containing protein n=1 Tax=unclassified Nocardioides TaxID=2615069 RepID=UPI0018862DF4|nr:MULTISPECIES: FHA domain-containing protein [unclassified Nocardioides]
MTDPTPETARPPHSGPRSYRPGEWYAVLGPRTVLLLPPDQRARAARLWELADEGADLEDLLDALLAGGLRSLSGFALAGVVEGGDTRVLLRGPVHAELRGADGVVSLDGTEASSFLDRCVTGVQQVTLSAGEANGPDLVLTDGLVRAARVDHPPYVAPAPDPPPAPAAAVQTPPAAPSPPPPPPSTPPPPPPPAPAPPAPGAVPFGGPDTGPIGAVDPEAEAPTALDLPAVPDFPPVPPPPMGGPSPVPATPPPGAPVGWGAGHREVSYHRGDDDPGHPAESEPFAREVEAPVARLIVSDGTVVDVDRPVLIGRAPSAGRAMSGEDARLVTVPSPHQEISATHLEVSPGIGADTGSAVVTDLGSTNGSVLARPGLPPEALQPGIAALLVPGSLIDLGDGVTIQVTTP